jgi:hypothetical protein
MTESQESGYRVTFGIRLHSGWEGEIVVRTGIYRDAAAAVPAILGIGLPVDLRIWCKVPTGIETHGHDFRVRENEFGGLVTELLVPSRVGEEGNRK